MKAWLSLLLFCATSLMAQISQTELQKFIQQIPGKVGKSPLRIAVGKVLHQESQLFGEASQKLREQMNLAVLAVESLQLVSTRGLRLRGYHVIEAHHNETMVVVFVKDPENNILMQKTWDCSIPEPGLPKNAGQVQEYLKDVSPPVSAKIPDLQLQMTTNKGNAEEVFYHGDKLVLEIKANKDCYLYIFYRMADGQVLQIFPNKYHSSNRIRAQRIYTIPNNNYGFEFEVDTSEIYGLEIVHAVASLEPMKQIPGEEVLEGMRAIKIKPRQVVEICREKGQTAEVTCVIRTEK